MAIGTENQNDVEQQVVDQQSIPAEGGDVDAKISQALAAQAQQFDEKLKTAILTEKSKLYDSLKKEKERADQAEARAREAAEALRSREDEEAAARNQELTAAERLAAIEAQQKAERVRTQEILDLQEKKFAEELARRDLEVLRERKIAEAKGEIIPELVMGNTAEEIEASVVKAKERYLAILEEGRKKIENATILSGRLPEPSGKDAPGVEPTKREFGNKSYEDLMNMDADDFSRYAKEQLDLLTRS